jgi:hypothetical protein
MIGGRPVSDDDAKRRERELEALEEAERRRIERADAERKARTEEELQERSIKNILGGRDKRDRDEEDE